MDDHNSQFGGVEMQCGGMPVVISEVVPLKPRVKISDNFLWITESERKRINDDLFLMFGGDEQILVAGGVLYMRQSTHDRLSKQ